ncbi:transcription elongation factor GreA [Clostridium amylolyticum]|uniref:Transcription elongation factor GreA n=1 Tax=Clostridium amylolyticum TaxID=1121298 RepID=A0A1M6NRD1_9CLOT|nr:transcription elongation factor GreA [Clostridium amylolyticum]SHJ98245.1 transcription elongation factor GreA [Clostridium amylolyticum]
MHNYLTEEAVLILKEEIEHRKTVVRRKINEDLKEARAHGDLSENFEYKAAKKDRAENEGRIRYLERMINTSTIIKDTTTKDEVGIGKTVTLNFLEDNEVDDFKIVTTIQADPLNNMISIECPLGKAIYKQKIGNKVKVESPEGEYSVQIENIILN